MRRFLLFFSLAILAINLSAQSDGQAYDSVLAKNLGADEYGMKQYVFVLLLPGTNHLGKGAERDSIFRGHRRNIGKLVDQNKMVIAGPFEDNDKSYQGIFILNVKTIAEARELLKTDPAVSSGLLDAELYEWYGSAAISEYLKFQKRITRKLH